MSKHSKQEEKDKKEQTQSSSVVVSIKEAMRKKQHAKTKRPDRHPAEKEILEEAKLKEDERQNWLRSICIGVALLAALQGMGRISIYEANNTIKTDVVWMQRIDRAMLNLRMHENQARKKYQQGDYVNVKQLNVDRIQYQKEVGDAYSGVDHIIGNNVSNSVKFTLSCFCS